MILQLQMLGGKGSSTGDDAASNRSRSEPQSSPATSSVGNSADDFVDSDLPF